MLPLLNSLLSISSSSPPMSVDPNEDIEDRESSSELSLEEVDVIFSMQSSLHFQVYQGSFAHHQYTP